jgi:hypothetical protein
MNMFYIDLLTIFMAILCIPLAALAFFLRSKRGQKWLDSLD